MLITKSSPKEVLTVKASLVILFYYSFIGNYFNLYLMTSFKTSRFSAQEDTIYRKLVFVIMKHALVVFFVVFIFQILFLNRLVALGLDVHMYLQCLGGLHFLISRAHHDEYFTMP